MFGDKQLHEVGYDELKAFLAEGREEGVRLDYKSSWTNRIIETACAFANTYGGHLVYGIKEVSRPNRPNQPDPENIPGIDFSKGDPAASLRSRILDNIRPPVVPEIRSVPLEGSEEIGVLIVVVEESVDAPHEVLIPGATRIPVRRADTTVPASLDEIERLIQRRDGLRRENARSLDVEFFDERFDRPINAYGDRLTPPVVEVTVRPRRINSLRFAFDSKLDDKIREMAIKHSVGIYLEPKPTPDGVAMEDSGTGVPKVRVEVRKDGTIRGARALSVATSNYISSGPEEKAVQEKRLAFNEIASLVCAVVRFATQAYAIKRPGVEMEVCLGLSNCEGYRTKIPAQSTSSSYEGQIPDSPFHQTLMQDVFVKTGSETGSASEEDLLNLVREISRFFQISVPDERLRQYLK
jgi:hypothetical protein